MHSEYMATDPGGFWVFTGGRLVLGAVCALVGAYGLRRRRGDSAADDREDQPTRSTGQNSMELETRDFHKTRSPTKEDIEKAVFACDLKRNAQEYVLLSATNLTYIQCTGDKDTRFELEHQEGSRKKHFRAAGDFAAEEIVEILWDYACGGSKWKTSANWAPGKSKLVL